MKILRTALLIATFLVQSPAPIFASEMLEKYNVGGYRSVPSANFYRLSESHTPSTLQRASRNELQSPRYAKIVSDIDAYMDKYTATTGIIVLIDGKIIVEKYAGLGSANSEFFSMSIGKSLTSLAIGKALCEGKIASLTDNAQKYVPELGNSNLGKSTIAQLLTMSSGAYKSARGGQPAFKYGIGQNPRNLKPYSGAHWPLRLRQVTIEELLWGEWWENIIQTDVAKPGTQFMYKSLDTLSLSMVIKKSTGRPVAPYFEDVIWSKIGSEKSAYWESDRNGDTISSSGFQASLRDWARLGIWIENSFDKKGCFSDYLREATRTHTPLDKKQSSAFAGYGYQWWTEPRFSSGFWGVGFAGQLLGIDPKANKIVIKFAYRNDKGSFYDLMSQFKNW
ncbi:serine hydrolase domain-containing protein [Sneathiella glossodoripedis]|uniref:serine hydrolase domain-containing protein n=1 Tax=Sneathiella glossodoripedis TaxID=418853 RepID=UPI0004700776|nr:serine hydrolase domain-containing protein [Sneathiella glossodoripedis]